MITESLKEGFFLKIFQNQQGFGMDHPPANPNLETLGIIATSRTKGGSGSQNLERAAPAALREGISTGSQGREMIRTGKQRPLTGRPVSIVPPLSHASLLHCLASAKNILE